MEDTSISNSTAVSTTVTVYNGDSTTVIPGIPAASVGTGAIPANAGTVQTTAVNALGQVTSLTQYNANPTLNVPSNTTTGTFYLTSNTGTPSATTYSYDAMGNQVQEAFGGATWKQAYNLLGRQTSATDATGGTTTLSYDPAGHLTQSQDPAGNFLSWTYDEGGRKTAEYAAASNAQHAYGTTGANQVAAWVYDDANGAAGSTSDAKGQASTVTSYANNHAYVVQQNGFNVFGESTGEKFIFDSTAPGAGLGTASGATTSLMFINIYEPINGELTKQTFPAAGGLPGETVTYSTVGALDLPGITGGNNGYAAAATYTALSQPEQVTLGSGSNKATVTYSYDARTGAVTDQAVKKTGNAAVDEVSYGYSPAGALTSETDKQNGSATTSELQCFAYTTNGQLAQAWTASSSCATVPTKASHSTVGDGLGTAAEYDEIWAYTSLDQPHTLDALVASSNAYATTTYGYTKSAELTSTSTTTSGVNTGSTSYTYNADSQQQTRSPNGGQTLAWNGQGDLTGVTKTTGGTTVAGYVYDAAGNLFTQTVGTKTTVYLPGEQLSIDTSTSPAALSGVRFYALPGGPPPSAPGRPPPTGSSCPPTSTARTPCT